MDKILYVVVAALCCTMGVMGDDDDDGCVSGEFECDNGNCITSCMRCDGVDDCQDQSDESEKICGCKAGRYTCTNDQCIPPEDLCDDENDCGDRSDEEIPYCGWKTEGCGSTEFRCNDGFCIQQELVCDGKPDCGGGEEEFGCPPECSGPHQYLCGSNECISRNLLCDDRNDCQDKSDESDCGCTEEQFLCENNLGCIPKNLTCDGQDACGDNSDEHHNICGCSSGEFYCQNGNCVPNSWVCDDQNGCGDNSDESAGMCVCTKGTQVDIVFVLDASDSVSEADFQTLKSFVWDTMSIFNIADNDTRLGMMTFAERPTIHFNLNSTYSKDVIENEITNNDKIIHRNGKSFTGSALASLCNTMFTDANGDRAEVPNIGVILTDEGAVDRDAMFTEAQACRNADVQLMVIAIGSNIPVSDFNEVASDPDSKYVIEVPNFDSLSLSQAAVRKNLCPLPGGSECLDNETTCPYTRICIEDSKLCDFIDDCGDGWDEQDEYHNCV